MAGFDDEKLLSNAHKKPFATFGLPKGKLLRENHKELCLTQYPQFPREKMITKQPLPKVELVLTNIKSDVDYIKLNTKTAKI